MMDFRIPNSFREFPTRGESPKDVTTTAPARFVTDGTPYEQGSNVEITRMRGKIAKGVPLAQRKASQKCLLISQQISMQAARFILSDPDSRQGSQAEAGDTDDAIE
jgi:hypothetical protein